MLFIRRQSRRHGREPAHGTGVKPISYSSNRGRTSRSATARSQQAVAAAADRPHEQPFSEKISRFYTASCHLIHPLGMPGDSVESGLWTKTIIVR
jgi:hypothetical protein